MKREYPVNEVVGYIDGIPIVICDYLWSNRVLFRSEDILISKGFLSFGYTPHMTIYGLYEIDEDSKSVYKGFAWTEATAKRLTGASRANEIPDGSSRYYKKLKPYATEAFAPGYVEERYDLSA